MGQGVRDFITRWDGVVGGAERANYGVFISELCAALDLPRPGIAAAGSLGDYQFEGPVPGGSLNGGTGSIDLYKRGHFILEAKQSKLPAAQRAHPELFDAAPGAPATPAGTRYDQLMRDARRQAEHYAHSLPGDHPPVPFVIVCDVGRAFELYFDYAGNGRGYAFFPDKRHYRIPLADLASDAKLPGLDLTSADLLRAIWTDPRAVDPRVRAADVTRDVARKLAQVSVHLEEQGRRELKRLGEAGPAREAELVEHTALFLMRMLFCMFAEDVGLLPPARFTEFLQSCVRPYNPDKPADLIDERSLENGLTQLWTAMDSPDTNARYAFALREQVRYFNGGLFETRRFFALARNDLDSLIDAARHRWTNVEPAIFGTLLEQALLAADRAKLGAHYTPRPYVERLVQATITDVLAPEWAAVQDAVEAARAAGDEAGALARAQEFLAYIQRQRVLDPACGTGNFLYVAMETLLRLESDVIELVGALGGEAKPRIGPENFLGLELNPRAAVIAELVLWIGWLRWRTGNDPDAVPDPVLRRTDAINFGGRHGYDAVLARDEAGEIAQPPAPAPWPEAEFIIGNPPFIGKGSAMRGALGDRYVEALWKANPTVPASADFVMFWWDRAADLLAVPDSPLRRFGLVTTNSITQEFSRRVIARHLNPPRALLGEVASRSDDVGAVATEAATSLVTPTSPTPVTPTSPPPVTPTSPSPVTPASPPPVTPALSRGPASSSSEAEKSGTPGQARGDEQKQTPAAPYPPQPRPLSLVFAVPDHPWTKAGKDAAVVRIAMTAAQAGEHQGRLARITAEHDLASDTPRLTVELAHGRINADLTIGSDVTAVVALASNDGISSNGFLLAGGGFVVSGSEAQALARQSSVDPTTVIRPYLGGSELVQKPKGRFVIDFYGLTEREARQQHPAAYEQLLASVHPQRLKTAEQSKTSDAKDYAKRWWQFAKQRAGMRDAIADLGRYIATVETSKHRIFAFVDPTVAPDHMVIAVASDNSFHLGVLSSRIHLAWSLSAGGTLEDRPRYNKSRTFDPFPFPDPTPDQRAAIADLAEELDATRKAALAEHPRLTMTGLYNLVEKLRTGTALTAAEEADARDARARIVRHLHDQLDQAVAAAYGWPRDLAPAEIVARLVALNTARAAEEAAGQIRWLRPEYQAARFANAKPSKGRVKSSLN